MGPKAYSVGCVAWIYKVASFGSKNADATYRENF